MPISPLLVAKVSITFKSLDNNSVTATYNAVTSLTFDFYKGMITLVDQEQGGNSFAFSTATVITDTINGNVHTIVIS